MSSAAASEPRPAATGSLTAPCDAEMFGRLRRSRRVWAVAAIHGEKARLQTLHRRLAQRLDRGDRLVYLGGYLGHGPEVAATLDELIGFRRLVLARRYAFPGDIAYLRGSQEEMWQKLLQLQFAPNPREVLEWMLERGMAATLASYGVEPRQGMAAARDGPLAITRWTAGLRAAIDARAGHRQMLTQLKRAALTEEGTLLFVHAGVDPGKPLDLQGDALWWGGANLLDLDTPFGGFRRVVRGYDRRHGGLCESPFAASIDGGSGFGGPLLAACFSLEGEVMETLEA